MLNSGLVAFIHHLAAFAIVTAVAVEWISFRPDVSVDVARRILRADQVYGMAAGVVLAVGILRVFFFEKGAQFYVHNAAFAGKMILFAVVAVLSIYPTVVFARWRAGVRAGRAPQMDAAQARRIGLVLRIELTGLAGVILCAALMAKGVGS